MEKLFIDESGTMTVNYCNIHPYFVVAIVRAKDPDRIKRVFKRFVKKHLANLKSTDRRGCMFNDDGFIELKGNCLTPELKRKFMNFFCQNELFEVFFIVADNHCLQLDERNERTETKHFLENYLNTELLLPGIIKDECKVKYFDSANNIIIQVADVFANLYFSQLKTNAYTEEFDRMQQEGYVKYIFQFPLPSKN